MIQSIYHERKEEKYLDSREFEMMKAHDRFKKAYRDIQNGKIEVYYDEEYGKMNLNELSNRIATIESFHSMR